MSLLDALSGKVYRLNSVVIGAGEYIEGIVTRYEIKEQDFMVDFYNRSDYTIDNVVRFQNDLGMFKKYIKNITNESAKKNVQIFYINKAVRAIQVQKNLEKLSHIGLSSKEFIENVITDLEIKNSDLIDFKDWIDSYNDADDYNFEYFMKKFKIKCKMVYNIEGPPPLEEMKAEVIIAQNEHDFKKNYTYGD